MKVVMSLGGSVIVPEEIDVDFVKGFANLINEMKGEHQFSIVTGGGRTCRIYTNQQEDLGLSKSQAHRLGIKATHLNAKMLAMLIGGRFSQKHPEEIGKMNDLIVSGGYKVGWTTDTDAAIIAESMNADLLINITDVKGIYNKDPHENEDAEFIPKMDWEKFEEMFGKKVKGAGEHYVFDPVAGQICKENNIKVIVLGKDVENIKSCIEGKDFEGTVVE